MIGKTRQDEGAVVVITNGVGPARGILRRWSDPGPGKYWHSRTAPPDELRGLVEHFWIVRWDLCGGAPQQQETLPHPNVHLVVAQDHSRIMGPYSGRFVRRLEGSGCVFGVKFRPGGFYPYLRKPISGLADGSLALRDVFGAAGDRLEPELLARNDDAGMIQVAIEFLTSHSPAPDPAVEQVSSIVAGIASDRSINSVDDLVQRHGLGKRALQRLFQQYVGVGPKWVINRYRLHEAVEQLKQGTPVDWAAVALELGYFDQAHFIRDFSKLVGRTPAEFARAESEPQRP